MSIGDTQKNENKSLFSLFCFIGHVHLSEHVNDVEFVFDDNQFLYKKKYWESVPPAKGAILSLLIRNKDLWRSNRFLFHIYTVIENESEHFNRWNIVGEKEFIFPINHIVSCIIFNTCGQQSVPECWYDFFLYGI